MFKLHSSKKFKICRNCAFLCKYLFKYRTCLVGSVAARNALTTLLMRPTAKLSSSMLAWNLAISSFGLLWTTCSLNNTIDKR